MNTKLTNKLAWILITINGILLLSLTCLWLVPMIRVIKKGCQISQVAHMKTYAVRLPFMILTKDEDVDKERKSFTLMDTRHPLFLNLNSLDSKGKMQNAQLCIGSNFVFSCVVSFEGKPKIHEYTLTMDSFDYLDLNADGAFDLRFSWQPRRRADIWLNGKWTEVAFGEKDGKHPAQLISGELYSFNMQTGMWCLVWSNSLSKAAQENLVTENPTKAIEDNGKKNR